MGKPEEEIKISDTKQKKKYKESRKGPGPEEKITLLLPLGINPKE